MPLPEKQLGGALNPAGAAVELTTHAKVEECLQSVGHPKKTRDADRTSMDVTCAEAKVALKWLAGATSKENVKTSSEVNVQSRNLNQELSARQATLMKGVTMEPKAVVERHTNPEDTNVLVSESG